MPRTTRRADVEWSGNLARGAGTLASESGALDGKAVSMPTRVGAHEGNTSPEELLAAALAGCYAMSLAGELTRDGNEPERLAVGVTCVLDEVEGGGHDVTRFEIAVTGRVAGIDGDAFTAVAERAERACPVSRLLGAGATVELHAALEA